jgi:uncharacterized protein (DUF1684 family)
MRDGATVRAATLAATLAAAVAAGCGERPPEPVPVDPEAHAVEVQAFADARVEELEAPDSWLSLIGLIWLAEGENTVGSAPDNDVVLPAKAAPRVGTLTVDGRTVRWRTEPGVTVTMGVDSTLDRSAGSGAISPAVSGDPAVTQADLSESPGEGKHIVLRHGDLDWIVIRRDERMAVRLRDNASETYDRFHGIDRYPTSPAWRVTARWVPHDKRVAVPNVLGTVTEVASPAALHFWIDGRRMSLDVPGGEEHGRYMLVFADSTSGRETYGGGRFLWIDGPDEDGRVVVDFNLAYNPPCVWTEFATCPLPTKDNRLPVAVEAGEKNWAEH